MKLLKEGEGVFFQGKPVPQDALIRAIGSAKKSDYLAPCGLHSKDVFKECHICTIASEIDIVTFESKRPDQRSFLVDITIAFPKGLSRDDWSYVGHLYGEMTEGSFEEDLKKIVSDIVKKTTIWQLRNPLEHDCSENPVEESGMYWCRICGQDVTPHLAKVVNKMKERVRDANAGIH